MQNMKPIVPKLICGISLYLVAGCLVFLATPGTVMAKNIVGVVDVMKTFQTTNLGKAIQAHLNSFQKKRADKMENERKHLQAEQKQIKQESGSLGKDELKAKTQKFRQEVQAYRKNLQQVRKEIAGENGTEIRKFLKVLAHATLTLGDQEGLEIIIAQHPIRVRMGPYPIPFQSSKLLYIKPSVDLTNSVIRFINKHNSPDSGG